mmetsp:Transcript_125662/g.222660  ORF Transcript_125662/g.222660 Transcript_125662/m.222660 type:complete len:212 (+) Transcript_125662:62-697(+)
MRRNKTNDAMVTMTPKAKSGLVSRLLSALSGRFDSSGGGGGRAGITFGLPFSSSTISCLPWNAPLCGSSSGPLSFSTWAANAPIMSSSSSPSSRTGQLKRRLGVNPECPPAKAERTSPPWPFLAQLRYRKATCQAAAASLIPRSLASGLNTEPCPCCSRLNDSGSGDRCKPLSTDLCAMWCFESPVPCSSSSVICIRRAWPKQTMHATVIA